MTSTSSAAPGRRYHTIPELAERWRTSERTVRRLIGSGNLRAVRIGHQLRVADDVLQRFEERHATGATSDRNASADQN
jgi:excisionase family DNA binding protein